MLPTSFCPSSEREVFVSRNRNSGEQRTANSSWLACSSTASVQRLGEFIGRPGNFDGFVSSPSVALTISSDPNGGRGCYGESVSLRTSAS